MIFLDKQIPCANDFLQPSAGTSWHLFPRESEGTD